MPRPGAATIYLAGLLSSNRADLVKSQCQTGRKRRGLPFSFGGNATKARGISAASEDLEGHEMGGRHHRGGEVRGQSIGRGAAGSSTNACHAGLARGDTAGGPLQEPYLRTKARVPYRQIPVGGGSAGQCGPPRRAEITPGHSALSQIVRRFAPPPHRFSSRLVPGFSPSEFASSARAILSATISRPIRLSSWRIIARRYCRPVHKCTARSKTIPAAHKCSLFIVLVMFMVRSMLAGIHLPIAAELTVASACNTTVTILSACAESGCNPTP